jgi:hypothetical protein
VWVFAVNGAHYGAMCRFCEEINFQNFGSNVQERNYEGRKKKESNFVSFVREVI